MAVEYKISSSDGERQSKRNDMYTVTSSQNLRFCLSLTSAYYFVWMRLSNLIIYDCILFLLFLQKNASWDNYKEDYLCSIINPICCCFDIHTYIHFWKLCIQYNYVIFFTSVPVTFAKIIQSHYPHQQSSQ